MRERQSENLPIENRVSPPVLSEIERPNSVFLELENRGEAVLVDQKFILAYQNQRPFLYGSNQNSRDKILVARERTIPIKVESTGYEFIYPYPNENELRGRYGVVILNMLPISPVFYVSEQYRVTNLDICARDGELSSFISIDSPKPIEIERIDGILDFSKYLEALNEGFI